MVYVADISDIFILGLNFLKEDNFKLEVKNNELHSRSEDVSLFINKNPEIKSVQHVKTGTEIIMPPRTDIFIRGSLNKNNSFRFGLIEYPKTNNSIKGVVVDSSVVNLSRMSFL